MPSKKLTPDQRQQILKAPEYNKFWAFKVDYALRNSGLVENVKSTDKYYPHKPTGYVKLTPAGRVVKQLLKEIN